VTIAVPQPAPPAPAPRGGWLGRAARGLGLGRILVLVALAAAGQRVAYVAEIHDHPFWRVPLVDAADYHTRAQQVMRGQGLGPGVYYKAPAYPWLVGQVYRITGPRLEAVYGLQMLGGVLTAVLIAALAAPAFGLAAGLLAGLMAGLYAPLPYYENQLLIEPAALTVSVLAAYVLCRGPGLSRAASRAGWLLDVLAGGLTGLALQLRPVNGAFVVALVAVVLVQRSGWNARFRRLACLLLPVLLVLVPTARHNRVASGRFVPVSVNGGINFFIGNNPDYDATVAIRPGLRWEELTERFGSMDDPVTWQQNFYRAAFDWMRRDPGAALTLWCRKTVLAWNRAEIDRNQDSSAMRGDSSVLRWSGVPWAVLGILGLVGLVQRWRTWRTQPAHLLALLQIAGMVAFFVTSRYRIAAVPWLAMLAGAAAVDAVAAWRVARRRLRLGAIAASGALLVLPPWFSAAQRDFGRPEFDRAEVLARRGDRVGARAAYEQALQRDSTDADVRLRYAEQLDRMGEHAAAIPHYRAAIRLAPRSYKPPLALGATLLEQGDLDAAWDALTDAERRGDRHGRALYDQALVRERQGRFADALALHRRALERPDTAAERLQRRLGAARALTALGQPEAAGIETAAARAEAEAAGVAWPADGAPARGALPERLDATAPR